MRIAIASIAVIASALATECPMQPAPAPIGDAAPPHGDASPASLAACANLADAGCEDGVRPNCAATMDRVIAQRLTPVNVACLTNRHTKPELRACGFVACK